jgi:FKBP-type peptidyl-prolyl cis-trans isomerase SlyD
MLVVLADKARMMQASAARLQPASGMQQEFAGKFPLGDARRFLGQFAARSSTRAPCMQISPDSVCTFHYTLKDHNGVHLESSRDGPPMTYLHGHDSLLKGLEDALVGKRAGDVFSVTLPPHLAFGELNPGSELRVPLSQLRGAKQWEPGMMAVIQTDQGHQQVTVVKVGHTMATVDTNHPMAGKTLAFDVEVMEVRAASEEELVHGHVHGAGGHHH